ncbi:MAG TPA: MaoC/PaaZ C-terminal domain-containing protein [Acidimicrobiales bacterium]|nr:MaoC/PaaZ C-terminal domain-containing protein [Acidimicrobiales bacterium]
MLFEEIEVGDEAPVLDHTLSRNDLVQYAGASGDFNPMHTDEVAAREAGMQSVFGHGMFSAGLLATALTNWSGVGSLVRYNVRFVKQTWPGERLSTRIRVERKRVEGGRHLIDVSCSLANEEGQEKVSGEATVTVPSAGNGGSG